MTRTHLSMSRVVGLVLASTLVLGLTMPAPAAARVTHRKAIWGPLEYGGHSAFPTYAHLGAGIFQWRLDWNGVALQRPAHPRDPADPAYRWPVAIDPAVAESRRYGIAVSLAVVGTPVWANGGRDARWAPNRPADYADFVYAAAKRYPRSALLDGVDGAHEVNELPAAHA